jgi:hypothetical protein
LHPRRIEIHRVKPCLDPLSDCRPLSVENGVPCGVTVPAFDYHVVEPDALNAKAEPFRGGATLRVQRIAAPLHPAINQIIHRVAKHQKQWFGRATGAGDIRREPDGADLDDAGFRLDGRQVAIPTA